MSLSAAPGLPLARLLEHTSDTLAGVRAGRSLTELLTHCPAPARPGTQALAFHVLRVLGSAAAVRRLAAPKTPPPQVDALLTTALALLWPAEPGAALPYPEHTLVDQAVAAARRRMPATAGFVNAVLRRFLRERDALSAAARREPEGAYNHPRWWIAQLQRDWPQHWQALLRAANRRAPMTLRVNARRGDADAYVRRLAAAGRAAIAAGPHAVVLAEPCPVADLPGFDAGDVSVQDAAAQLAAPLLLGAGLRAGARVLDACAAPGGKTAHLLELAELDLLALDHDALRLARVEETLVRLGLSARVQAADAADPAAWWDGEPFDAILLDAPCTASGIVRRHPDIRWLRRAGDVAALARQQARLLDALWPLLKPGGRLLYATCSVFRAEGQAQIDAFLQRPPGHAAQLDPASPGHLLPLADNPRQGNPGSSGAVPLAGASGGLAPAGGMPMPAAADPDGFFYALLHKP
jgi:16S rRNA (cytosine967-C5)-methyltransferase